MYWSLMQSSSNIYREAGRKMIRLYDGGVYLVNGNQVIPERDVGKVAQLTGDAGQGGGKEGNHCLRHPSGA